MPDPAPVTAADPSTRAAELRGLLDDANHRYHVLDAPTISDREYDLLFRELTELEAVREDGAGHYREHADELRRALGGESHG